MPDNKKIKTKQDRTRVDANDPSEVAFLARQFPGLPNTKIIEAISAHGPFRKKITAHLRKSNKK